MAEFLQVETVAQAGLALLAFYERVAGTAVVIALVALVVLEAVLLGLAVALVAPVQATKTDSNLWVAVELVVTQGQAVEAEMPTLQMVGMQVLAVAVAVAVHFLVAVVLAYLVKVLTARRVQETRTVPVAVALVEVQAVVAILRLPVGVELTAELAVAVQLIFQAITAVTELAERSE